MTVTRVSLKVSGHDGKVGFGKVRCAKTLERYFSVWPKGTGRSLDVSVLIRQIVAALIVNCVSVI